jgi:hypothetical protein
MVRLAIAHLAGNPRFEELAETYARELHALALADPSVRRPVHPDELKEFEDFLARLREARSPG